MLSVKRFARDKERVVAMCDSELLGKILREGEVVINLDKHRKFYEGELVSEESAKKELSSATSMNLVGKRAVALALSAGLVKTDDVKKIAGVPHVQIYKI